MPFFSANGTSVFFSHIPKTGGTSLEKTMEAAGVKISLWSNKLHENKREGFPCSPQHWHNYIVKELFPDFENKFAVVRNPLDRIVSEYKHRARWSLKNNRTLRPFSEWLDFVIGEYSRNAYFLDNHIRPQAEFVDSSTSIFKIENGLEGAIKYACDILNMESPENILSLNKGADINVDINGAVLNKVRSIYNEDLELFGYELEDSKYFL
ncbi:sulfotransferase family 2 domain-containing protein [Chromohalobacter sp.]|uniref:sulfotransferase family 2 domain-containing protein n=1 Tax=Chromohalobacter sp. TaxID=50740 RepID=UPI001D8A9653|nr:sulfotransferase family 2 domain-containing protein [Chromohalobacter sp.]NQY44353.1 sulfotransferase family 2 domain-containing protein [Chromohalobacter sp.]